MYITMAMESIWRYIHTTTASKQQCPDQYGYKLQYYACCQHERWWTKALWLILTS